MRLRQVNEEVLYGGDSLTMLGRQDIASLKEMATRNQRKRIRLCAHKDEDDALHEMFIVHMKETYVKPHKHLTKGESFHVVEGTADVILFDEIGNITDVIPMGDYTSARRFYYRLSDPSYHTVLITSEFLVFHESSNGPFRKADTVLAPWAPEENDRAAVRAFMEQLAESVENFSRARA